jgi:hypothetical protein
MTISEVYKADRRFPSAAGIRLPIEAQRVGRGKENGRFNRKFSILERQLAWRRDMSLAVEVHAWSKAVIEKDVPVVVRIGVQRGRKQHRDQGQETETTRNVEEANERFARHGVMLPDRRLFAQRIPSELPPAVLPVRPPRTRVLA